MNSEPVQSLPLVREQGFFHGFRVSLMIFSTTGEHCAGGDLCKLYGYSDEREGEHFYILTFALQRSSRCIEVNECLLRKLSRGLVFILLSRLYRNIAISQTDSKLGFYLDEKQNFRSIHVAGMLE